MERSEEYRLLSKLEQETTRMRYATFTALISVSFILPGLALQGLRGPSADILLLHNRVTLPQAVFLLGFIFYLFAIFHYQWYHRYSHKYRSALKKIEHELDISVYRLRVRPHV